MITRREFFLSLGHLGAGLMVSRLFWLPPFVPRDETGLLSTSAMLELGLYDPDCPPRVNSMQGLEERLQAPVRMVSWFQAWGSGFKGCFPGLVAQAHRHGLRPLVTWEPWKLPPELPAGTLPHAQPDFSLKNIASGAYDDYVRSWARSLSRVAMPVYLRPMHEMNGDWYPWGGTVNGNEPGDFIRAWKHLRRLFLAEGAAKVRWVWCPFAISVPDIEENALEGYFPGASEVDWLALDVYNHCTQGARWEPFTRIFGAAYRRLCALAPDKPVMIAEIGCAEEGGDKAAWIRETLKALPAKFPRVKILVWFNINKECDWRIDSSPEALAAFQEQGWRFS
jgi:hypothetical protein